ncbi:MAG: protein kinase [Micropruina sp.]|uniref:protein kinase domain-containing protein n=1 Tax=Micropruina sp. TaxID=2737536 RepID=UPI0039E2F176
MRKANALDIGEQGSYKRLARAVAVGDRPLIAIIGSGLSSPRIPGWSALYKSLHDELEQQACSSDEAFDRYAPHLDQIERSNNLWEQFGVISKIIPTEYRNIIRSELGASQSGPIPEVHQALWSLPLAGVVSLNIDTYARRAGTERHVGKEFKIEQGVNAGRIQRLLLSPHPFLYELHGTLDDEASWVFTKSDLDHLYSLPGYQQFLGTVYSQFRVIFIGISADDVAIGGPLKRLSMLGMEGPEHFWITDRTDSQAVEWAESARVERILYENAAHHQVVAIINRLAKAVEPEPEASPIWTDAFGSGDEIADPETLGRQPTDEIRLKLNRYAGSLLRKGRREEYEEFVLRYDELIDRAWYIPPNPIGYKLFSYTLQSLPAKGAFGAVYRASTDAGDDVALKLLKREIRDNLPLLHSFRRGVEAMKILEDKRVEGMAVHKDASEIPTFVTMEWIEGPNLATAKSARLLDNWPDILDIAVQVCKIVQSAHQLPERVLHRDLRPTNIMLRNGWSDTDNWDVVVLDFDLATYLHASNDSVLADGSVLGYLAPEQLIRDKGTSSRSALVDSFGLGMTLYYLVSGIDPEAYMHRTAEFRSKVANGVRSPSGNSYRATPNRIARLIQNAAKDAQRERWSIPLILRELERLQEANTGAAHALDSDLVAEEIACNCPMMAHGYDWRSEDDTASYRIANGPTVSLHALASDLNVTAHLTWADEGTLNRKSMHKFLPMRVDKAKAELKKSGWYLDQSKLAKGGLDIVARCPVSVDINISALGQGLSLALEGLTFD